MKIQLVMFKSDGSRRAFPITGPQVLVGRKADCDLRLPLACVSRHHCALMIDPETGQVTLRDLDSSNGTYRNGERVQEVELTAGDEIQIGPVVFTVVINGQPKNFEGVDAVLEADQRIGSVPGNLADDHDTLLTEEDEAGRAAAEHREPLEAL